MSVLLSVALLAAPIMPAADHTSQEIREVAQRYAACIIRRSPGEARRFLVERDRRPPVIGDCLVWAMKGMGGQMVFPSSTYRYAMAEALLARDYASGLPDGMAGVAALRHEAPEPLDEANLPKGKRGEAAREEFRAAQGFHVLNVYTECVARADGRSAMALVASGLGDATETAAIAALRPALSGCMPDGGTVKFNRSMLRGSLAYNLYRLANAVRPIA